VGPPSKKPPRRESDADDAVTAPRDVRSPGAGAPRREAHPAAIAKRRSAPEADPRAELARRVAEEGATPWNPEEAPALRPIGTYLPRAHLRILAEESKLFSARRGQFLEMLLKRKLGLLPLERPPHAPDYEFSDDELRASERFVWYLREDMKVLFDRDRMQMGDFAVQAWIVLELNRWIGRPNGLRSAPAKE
jgi:hypothetical protein